MPSFVLRSLAVATFAMAACALAQQPYRVVDHWKVGGTGGWDYLLADPSAHLLYLTHGPRVEVIDTQTGKAVGAITGMKGTHGVALDPEGAFGYISDGGANAVIVFDRKTFATLASIPAGTNPDGITYEPVTKTVWAFNGRSRNATVINTRSRTVVATIALPGKPEFPQADGKGHVFDNIEDKNSIVRLDAATNTLTDTFPVAGCDSPSVLRWTGNTPGSLLCATTRRWAFSMQTRAKNSPWWTLAMARMLPVMMRSNNWHSAPMEKALLQSSMRTMATSLSRPLLPKRVHEQCPSIH